MTALTNSRGHPSYYLDGVGATLLSGAGYMVPFYVAFPLSGVVQIVALGVLTAVFYGVVNNTLAARDCVEYYTIGHNTCHKRLLASNNPLLNGIVSGIHDTWRAGLRGGAVLALAARASRLVAATAYRLTPFAFGLASIVLLYAQYASKIYKLIREKSKDKERETVTEYFQKHISPKPGYDRVALSQIPENKRIAYLVTAERNRVGRDLGLVATAVMAIAVFGGRIGLQYF